MQVAKPLYAFVQPEECLFLIVYLLQKRKHGINFIQSKEKEKKKKLNLKISVHLIKGVQLARENAVQGVWRGS